MAHPCYDRTVTIQRWRECRSCGKRLLDFGAINHPGRNRQFCDNACRQAGHRARRADPVGWARDQTARDRRARNRDKRVEDHAAEFTRGVKRMAQLNEAEFHRLLREVSLPPDSERLLDDPKVRALLLRALVSDFDAEAASALAVARRLHRNPVTNRS